MRKIAQYKEIVKTMMSKKRFIHSCCVAEEAKRLALKYGADVEKAEIAGILHDITKEISNEEQLKLIDRFDIMLNIVEKNSPKLWHAATGAAYAENLLDIKDMNILSAIRWHTSGRSDMLLMEKIIFVADLTAADRVYEDVEEVRKAAESSLEEAMIEVIRFAAANLLSSGKLVEAGMIDAYNEAVSAVRNRKN